MWLMQREQGGGFEEMGRFRSPVDALTWLGELARTGAQSAPVRVVSQCGREVLGRLTPERRERGFEEDGE